MLFLIHDNLIVLNNFFMAESVNKISDGIKKIILSKSQPGFNVDSKLNFCNTLREEYPNKEIFLICIFLDLAWIQRDTSYLSIFTPNAGKYGQEKTLYLDTFHKMIVSVKSFCQQIFRKNLIVITHFLKAVCWYGLYLKNNWMKMMLTKS